MLSLLNNHIISKNGGERAENGVESNEIFTITRALAADGKR